MLLLPLLFGFVGVVDIGVVVVVVVVVVVCNDVHDDGVVVW